MEHVFHSCPVFSNEKAQAEFSLLLLTIVGKLFCATVKYVVGVKAVSLRFLFLLFLFLMERCYLIPVQRPGFILVILNISLLVSL